MKKSIGSGRGSIYNIILKALQSGDKYGYEICKEVEEKTNGSYILKQPSLYSGLKRLEAQGDVSSYWQDSALGGRRHYYSLTESGKTRIEQSNFNWQDARDDIVETLFEKSQIDETIEDAKKDIDSLKTITETNEENQRDIDFVLQNTEELANAEMKKEIEENSEKNELNDDVALNDSAQNNYYNSNVDDLFSLFKTVEETETEEASVETSELQQDIDFKVEDEENLVQKSEENYAEKDTKDVELEEKTEQIDTKEEQLDLFSFLKTQENSNQIEEDIKKEEKHPEPQETTNAFNDIEKNLQTVEYSENEDTTLQEKKVEEEAIESADEFEESNKEEVVVEKDVFEEESKKTQEDRTVLLEKTNNDAMEAYREKHFGSNSFADNTVFEKPDNSFSNFESLDNFSLNSFLNETNQEEINDNKNQLDEKTEINSNIQDNIETINAEKTESSLDYKDIFGDLVSSENKNESVENSFDITSEQYENKKNYPEQDQANDYERNGNVFEEKPHAIFDDLPRNTDALNNINYTLMTNSNVETQQQAESKFEPYETSTFEKYENPFEKYDTYDNFESSKQTGFENNTSKIQNFEAETHQSNTQNNKMAFDKKYANAYNKFEVPDYEIRYSKKNYADNTSLRFVSINKLNLFDSFVISFLICLFTTITMVVTLTKVTIPPLQMSLFVTSFVFALLHLLFNFLKYASNKNKKIQAVKKVELSNILFISIFVIILTIAVNLFMGINFENLASFSASFFLPLFYVIILAFNNSFKRFLSRFKNFYN